MGSKYFIKQPDRWPQCWEQAQFANRLRGVMLLILYIAIFIALAITLYTKLRSM